MLNTFFGFGAENGLTEAREAFKNAPGGRGFVLTEYWPVASHGDPVYIIVYALSLLSMLIDLLYREITQVIFYILQV